MDDVNLSLRQQMRIIMDGNPRNRNTEVSARDDDNDKDHEEGDKGVSELIDKLARAVNVATQDKFPYLQHPGKIIYLKKKREDTQISRRAKGVLPQRAMMHHEETRV